MAKEVEKPKEELAPAYFVQYSALWCIMLGFFVLLLSLGNTQDGLGNDGVGAVRDAFGTSGGLGMMPFAQNAFGGGAPGSSSLRIVRSTETAPKYSMEGFVRGMLSKQGLSDLSLWVVEEVPGRPKVIIGLPIKFRDDKQLETESVQLLEVLSEVIFHLAGHQFECMLHLDSALDSARNQRKALLRATVVARFLSEACALPLDTVRSVGYYDSRFVRAYGIEDVSGRVLLSIQ